MLRFDRKQQNSAKQLSFKKKEKKTSKQKKRLLELSGLPPRSYFSATQSPMCPLAQHMSLPNAGLDVLSYEMPGWTADL